MSMVFQDCDADEHWNIVSAVVLDNLFRNTPAREIKNSTVINTSYLTVVDKGILLYMLFWLKKTDLWNVM